MYVLLAEDDRAVRESLVRALTLEGYDVSAVSNGALALEALRARPADLLLLDVSMPVVDGITVCRVLRGERNRVPILMLTARTETSDRVAGLDAGADDYLPKPFDLAELFARMRALLRRLHDGDDDGAPDGEVLRLGDLRIESSGRRVTRGSAEIELSKTEYELLELLVRNAGVVLDHSTIYDRIWHYDFGPDSKNLAVYIGYLRRKTEEGGGDRLIHTVRGVGLRRAGGAVSLRWKIALALAGLTFVASAVVGIAVYRVTKDRLLNEIDRSLADVNPRPGRGPFQLDQLGDRGPLRGFEAQVVLADGQVAETTFEDALASSDLVDPRLDPSPWTSGRQHVYETVSANGDDYRVRSVGIPRGCVPGGAVARRDGAHPPRAARAQRSRWR